MNAITPLDFYANLLNNLNVIDVKMLKVLYSLKIGRYSKFDLKEFNKQEFVPKAKLMSAMKIGIKKYQQGERALEVLGFVEKSRGTIAEIRLTHVGKKVIEHAIETKHSKFL